MQFFNQAPLTLTRSMKSSPGTGDTCLQKESHTTTCRRPLIWSVLGGRCYEDHFNRHGTYVPCGQALNRWSAIGRCPHKCCWLSSPHALCGVGQGKQRCSPCLLRSGELLNACLRDIVSPQDVRFSIDHVLIKILEPKTRFRAARHQSSKLEPPDLIQVAWIGLGRLKPHEKVWPGSPSTVRHRLYKVLTRLGLPIKVVNQQKPLTLASFGPGGATYLIGLTESAELVRRRGRWLLLKVMDIYLQEVAASAFVTDIHEDTRATILTAMENFEALLQLSVSLTQGFPRRCGIFFSNRMLLALLVNRRGRRVRKPEWLTTSHHVRDTG